MKRKLSEAQLEAMQRNAAKARKVLKQKLKNGEVTWPKRKPQKPEERVIIPLNMLPAMPPTKLGRKPRAPLIERDAVDGLAQLTVAVWAEYQRRKGTI